MFCSQRWHHCLKIAWGQVCQNNLYRPKSLLGQTLKIKLRRKILFDITVYFVLPKNNLFWLCWNKIKILFRKWNRLNFFCNFQRPWNNIYNDIYITYIYIMNIMKAVWGTSWMSVIQFYWRAFTVGCGWKQWFPVKRPTGVTVIYPHAFINGSSQAKNAAVIISQIAFSGGNYLNPGQCHRKVSPKSKSKF